MPSTSRTHEEGAAEAYLQGTSSSGPTGYPARDSGVGVPGAGRQRAPQQGSYQVVSAIRRIAIGRKGWLFVGSDEHGEAAGNVFSLIASARLHRLDPEGYLRDNFRVLAHWPGDRYLELAPKYWAQTRARLDADKLAAEVGLLTIPPPIAVPAAEKVSAD